MEDVMRKLILKSENKKRQLIDGIRIFEDRGWVLLTPDQQTASFNIVAESNSREETEHLITHYKTIIEEYQTEEETLVDKT